MADLDEQARRRRLRKEAIDHYGGCCECCGEDRFEFLAIDHTGGRGAGAAHRQVIGTTPIYEWLRRNGYPEGFRILCHNCNLALGFYGYCPHQNVGAEVDGDLDTAVVEGVVVELELAADRILAAAEYGPCWRTSECLERSAGYARCPVCGGAVPEGEGRFLSGLLSGS